MGENCHNATDLENKQFEQMTFDKFISLPDNTSGRTYCYDIDQLVNYLIVNKRNINPYNNLPFWNDIHEFDKIFLSKFKGEIYDQLVEIFFDG